jgi:hypothetical protein
MESRLEEAGRAELFRRDFRFLRCCLARTSEMSCGEGELQRLERTIQMLLLELRDLLASSEAQSCVCMGRY